MAESKLWLVFALLAGLATSVIALPFFLSDIGPKENPSDRAVWIWLIYFLGGMLTGFLIGRRWYYAILIGWFQLTEIAIPVYACFLRPEPAPNEYYCLTTVNMFWVSLITLLIGSYLGSRIRLGVTGYRM